MIEVLDLFSGIGGFSLGLERTGGFKTVAFCEIETSPRAVLKKHWPEVPCFEDIRKLTRKDIDGPVRLICGGYPCQPFSNAGKRQGKEDDRHLWPEVNRLLDEFRPDWFLGENVAGHISMGLDDVLSDLEAKGYSCRTFVIPACAVDAKHRRDRVWIVANSSDGRCGKSDQGQVQQPRRTQTFSTSETVGHTEGKRCGETGQSVSGSEVGPTGAGSKSGDVAHARHTRLHKRRIAGNAFEETTRRSRISGHGLPSRGEKKTKVLAHSKLDGRQGERQDRRASGSSRLCGGARSDKIEGIRPEAKFWPTEPDVGRVAHGVPARVDRLKALGNAVVPQVVEQIGYAILEAERVFLDG